MCEPLRGKVRWYEDGQPLIEFVDVKSAFRFYLKYRNNPEYFTHHFPDNVWWKHNGEQYEKANMTSVPARDFEKEHWELQKIIDGFNNWLLHYTFEDVLK